MDREFFEQHGIVQLDGETELAYRALRQYLQMPSHVRSLSKLAEDGFAHGSVTKWSARHDWQSRAQAFDASVVEDGLTNLLTRRQSLVLDAIERSLEDASLLRQSVMRMVQSAREADKLGSLVSSRVEVDMWITQILGLLNELEARNAET